MSLPVDDRFRLIAETISEVFWVASADLTRMLYISPAYERIWGRSVDGVLADPRSFYTAVHPDDHQVIPVHGEPFEREYRIVRPDGEIRRIWSRGAPVRDDGGAITSWIGVAQDVTEKRDATVELAALVERFRLVSEATSEAVWDWDITTGTTWWSDCHFTTFGFDRATTPGFEAWSTAIHPEDRERVVTDVKAALARGETRWSDEYRVVTGDGRTLDVLDRGQVFYDGGKPVRMVGALMDITARRALENQLRHAQKMDAIGRLAAGIAHDFNNILQSAVFELAPLLRAPPSTSAAEHLRAVQGAIDRAAGLTRQLLVFSRGDAGHPRAVDLDRAIGDCARMLGRVLGEDVELAVTLGSRATVRVDPSMLDQVLINLAVNARDAMPRGGTFAIATSLADHQAMSARAAGSYACLAVRDSGTGMSPDVRARIFEPFFTTKAPGQGAGFGLSTVHGIVEQHGGWIEVESEVGRGAAFRVYLPATGEPPSVEPAAPRTSPRGTETILLVEDDAHVRRAVRGLLEDSGYDVLEAERAAEGLLAWEYERERIAVVITDLVMPGAMSGRELAAHLVGREPKLPVILTTGYSRDLELPELGRRVTVLHKPIDPNLLLSVIRDALDTRLA